MEKPWMGNDSINVRFWCGGWNAMRGFNFKITQAGKKLSDLLQNLRPLTKGIFTPGPQPVSFHDPIP
jgi:hypothetical protein